MTLLGNIIWFIFFGWWNFLLYGFLGLVCCATIIGIPIGKALFQYAKLMTFPFGKVIIKETELKGKENVSAIRRVGGTIANILWLPVGIITFILNIGTMIVCAITIIGIPVAVVIAKSCKFLIWPVGAKVITKDEAEALRMEKSMMKVMGTAMAVNNAMISNQAAQPQAVQVQAAQPQAVQPQAASMGQIEQTQQTVQLNQTLDSFKAGSAQALESIRETGGKAMSAIAATGSAGASALKNRQMTIKKQVLERQKDVTVDELLEQTEVKLYQNKVMAWIMPFLEYITLAVGIISVIVGMIAVAVLGAGTNIGQTIIIGLFYGIVMAAPLMIMEAVLGMIKRSHVFVLIVLGAQLLAYIGLAIMGMGLSALWIICYLGIIYMYLFMIRKSAGQRKAASGSGIQKTTTGTAWENETNTSAAGTASYVRKYCGKCGAEISGGIAFCGKCGAKVE